MKTLKLNNVSRVFLCMVGILGSVILVSLPTLSDATQNTSEKIQSRQLAEQIYHQIRDRYPVRNYSFDDTEGVFLATFYLEAGMVLTYNAQGHLVKRLEPEGYEIQYEKGYPIKKVSPLGDLIWTIDYTWTTDRRVKRAIRKEGLNTTVSYFDDSGVVLLETHEGPHGLVFRYQFTRENHQIYSYFETSAATGMTDMYFVSAVSGLIEDHWRVSGKVEQIWDEKYDVFMQRVLDRFRRDYADRKQFKKDSSGKTRGDVLLKNLQPENILSHRAFAENILEKKIKFDDAWEFIDCSDVRITIPVVELIESEKVLVQKAKVQGNKVMVWVKERLQWEVYPFDNRVEELIPVNMRGDVRIESRYQKNQWKIIPGKQLTMYLSVRMMVPEIMHQKLRERLSQHLHDDPDFDDLFTVMQQAASQPTPTPFVQTGEAVTKFNRAELDTFRIELAFQVKNLMQASPQLNQRDSFQKTQAELILQILTPEKILSYGEFVRQKNRLRRHRMLFFDKIEYSNLEIFTPEIKKEKLYKKITKVRKVRGLIQVWQEDTEHPDRGYWTPYALRASRDTLIHEKDSMVIRVDEGKFKWKVTPVWKGKIVSGEVFFARVSDQEMLVAADPVQSISGASEQEDKPGGDHIGTISNRFYLMGADFPTRLYGPGLVGGFFVFVIQRMMEGQTGENIIDEKLLANETRMSLAEIRNWHGKILGYQRFIHQGDKMLSQARYNTKKQLLSMKTFGGDTYSVESNSVKEHWVVRRRGRERQTFHFVDGILVAIELADKKMFKITATTQFYKVELYDRAENLIYTKIYNHQGEQVGLELPDGEKVQYFYNRTKNILGLTLGNKQGQEATLVLDQHGAIVKHAGNGKLVYFASKQLGFIKPDHFVPLKIDFQLQY